MTDTLEKTDVEEDLSSSHEKIAHCYRNEDADRLAAGIVKSMIALCGHRTTVLNPASTVEPRCPKCVEIHERMCAHGC